MKLAASLAAMVSSPHGRYWVGPCFLVWCHGPDLVGTLVWGSPTEHDFEQLIAAWEHTRVMPGPFDVITDLSRVEVMSPLVFAALAQYVGQRRSEYLAKIRAHAQLASPGMVAATVAGFNLTVEQNRTWFVASDLHEALRRLGRAANAAVADELLALMAAARGESTIVQRVRALVTEHPGLAAGAVARQLGISLRSLQRTLTEAGTTFLALRSAVRQQIADQLLAESGHKLEVVAHRVGLKSREGLARLLRKPRKRR